MVQFVLATCMIVVRNGGVTSLAATLKFPVPETNDVVFADPVRRVKAVFRVVCNRQILSLCGVTFLGAIDIDALPAALVGGWTRFFKRVSLMRVPYDNGTYFWFSFFRSGDRVSHGHFTSSVPRSSRN